MPLGCLLPSDVNKFRKALKEKTLNMADLMKMETEERTKLLAGYVGGNAKTVNSLFEQKLILKNRLQGLKNWASKVGQVGRYDPATQAELKRLMEEYKSKQQERIFNPQENEAFLADLAEQKLGTRITREEAQNIFDLTSNTEKLLEKYDKKTKKWTSEKDRLAYGSSKVVTENYVEYLIEGNITLKSSAINRILEAKKTAETNKAKALFDLFSDTIQTISDNSISLVASFDNSFLGRQGLKTLMTHPTVWWRAAKQSFIDFGKTLGGQNMKDALLADIYSQPNYIDKKYEIAKLIPKTEEQYPSLLISERIPGVGKVLKASETAFTGSALRMRTGLYDLLAEVATKNGVDMDNKVQIQDIGKLINSLTARGQWGKRGEPGFVRLILWAPKMLKANIDVLTGHGFGSGLETSFARKQAATNLMKIVGITALIMMIAKAIDPDSVELDCRSADLGKIKAGNTRFDITGGAGSLLVLACRLATNSTKSTTTDIITKYGTDYGQSNRLDIIVDFLIGKTTPAMRVVIDLLQGRTFKGEAPTMKTELFGTLVPISIQNAIELKDDYSVAAVLGVIADVFGINANTYIYNTDWSQNTGVELQQFKEKVGDAEFKKANDLFNKEYNTWLQSEYTKFKSLPDEEKKKLVAKKKDEIKQAIFKKYNFKYKSSSEPKKVKKLNF